MWGVRDGLPCGSFQFCVCGERRPAHNLVLAHSAGLLVACGRMLLLKTVRHKTRVLGAHATTTTTRENLRGNQHTVPSADLDVFLLNQSHLVRVPLSRVSD